MKKEIKFYVEVETYNRFEQVCFNRKERPTEELVKSFVDLTLSKEKELQDLRDNIDSLEVSMFRRFKKLELLDELADHVIAAKAIRKSIKELTKAKS